MSTSSSSNRNYGASEGSGKSSRVDASLASPDESTKTCSKKTWTAEEDELLKSLVNESGTKSWIKVGSKFPDRSGKQCRERWYNHLDPAVKKGDWSEEEDRVLLELQASMGNQWAMMTKSLPGRSDNAIKNRFHAISRVQSRSEKGNHHHSNAHKLLRSRDSMSSMISSYALHRYYLQQYNIILYFIYSHHIGYCTFDSHM